MKLDTARPGDMAGSTDGSGEYLRITGAGGVQAGATLAATRLPSPGHLVMRLGTLAPAGEMASPIVPGRCCCCPAAPEPPPNRLCRLTRFANARVKDMTLGSSYLGAEMAGMLPGLPCKWGCRLGLHDESRIRAKPPLPESSPPPPPRRRLRSKMKRASSAARIAAAATTPPAIPPTCALERLEEAAAAVASGVLVVVVPVVTAVLVGEVLVLVANVDVGVAVEAVDVVERMAVELVFEGTVHVVVLVSGTKTDPEITTRVAVSVACVSGAALGWLSHMP